MEESKVGTIDNIKDKIVNTLLIFFAIIAVPMLISSISRTTTTGWNPIYTFQTIVTVLYIAFSLLRKHINRYVKAAVLMFVLVSLSVAALTFLGFMGNGKMFFVLAAIFSSILLGRKYGLIMVAIIVLTITVYGYLYLNGYLKYSFDVREFITRPSVWISYGITLVVVTTSLILIINKFEDAYLHLLKQSAQSEAYFRLLFDQASEGIVISDYHGVIQKVNENFNRIFGYTRTEVIGENISSILEIADEAFIPLELNTLLVGETVTREIVTTNKNGSEQYIEIRAQKLPDGRMQSFVRDITEQKQIVQEIEEERAFTDAVIESMPGLFYVYENGVRMVKWNRTYERESGYTSEELMNMNPLDYFPPSEKDNMAKTIENVFSYGTSTTDAFFQSKEGKLTPYLFTGIPFHRNEKDYFCGIGLDISQLKETQRQLEAEILFSESLLKSLPGIFYVFEDYERLVQWNENLEKITGYRNVDLMFKHPNDLFSKDDQIVMLI